MKKLKAALHVFTQSLTSPKYYNKLIKTDFKFSLKYYIVLAFLFTLATSLNALIPLLPKINQGVEDALTYAHELYDDDLVITLENGEVSINKEEPYIVPFPSNAPEAPKNLIVFDSEGTLDDLERTYDTLFLINSRNILVRNEERIQAYPVGNFPDGEFTEDDLAEITDSLRSFGNFIPYIVGTILFLAVLFYYLVFRLIYLFFVSVILWIAGLIRGLSFEFINYYQIALHAITLPLCLELLNNFFKVQVTGVPWFILLHLVFGLVIIFMLNKSVGEGVAEEASEEVNEGELEVTIEASGENADVRDDSEGSGDSGVFEDSEDFKDLA